MRIAVSMSDNHEPPRMKLVEMWPQAGLGPFAENPPATRRKIVKPPIERRRCGVCLGEMMRSRVRFYERPWVIWLKMRPYRCMKCGARRWSTTRRLVLPSRER
jgi:hypothetical protein